MNCAPKVSVIIPVYGVENYIERCARSLFEQTLDAIEYLFINDCTPDSSIKILTRTLEDYPCRRDQVRVINMDHNSGQAAVRRRGMLEARGEYMIHCDSDDWVEPDMYERMYKLAITTDSDIVSCNFSMNKSDNTSQIVENIDNPDPRFHINYIANNTWWTLWSRLVRTDLILNKNLLPISGMNMWEDMYVNIRAYYFANHIVHLAEPLYHYNISREDSIVANRMDKSVIQQQISCIRNLEEFFEAVSFDAAPFLNYRKCIIKSKYLQLVPVDYKGFKCCFPETKKYFLECSKLYKICWELAAHGFVYPHKLYVKNYNFKSWIFNLLHSLR